MKRKGLLVDVYRPKHDCTGNGITSKVDEIILVDPENDIGPFEIDEGEVYLEVVRRNIGGEYLHARVMRDGQHLGDEFHEMAGGNFVYSSDSRFPNRYPISVHDRFENWT